MWISNERESNDFSQQMCELPEGIQCHYVKAIHRQCHCVKARHQELLKVPVNNESNHNITVITNTVTGNLEYLIGKNVVGNNFRRD